MQLTRFAQLESKISSFLIQIRLKFDSTLQKLYLHVSSKNTFYISICADRSKNGIEKYTQKDRSSVKIFFLLLNGDYEGKLYSVKCFGSRLNGSDHKIYRDYLEKIAASNSAPNKYSPEK